MHQSRRHAFPLCTRSVPMELAINHNWSSRKVWVRFQMSFELLVVRFKWCEESYEKVNIFMILECGADYAISASDSGYQTQETFEGFVKNVLVNELDSKGIVRNARNPVFYFLDGHRSHYSFKFILWGRENFIIIITFFPNATRILQMCDVGMFSPGKKDWTTAVQRWQIDTNNLELDEVAFVKILKKVNDKFIKKQSIINGFRVTGIQPFNVMFDRCIGYNSSTNNTSSTETSSISETALTDVIPEQTEKLDEPSESQTATEIGMKIGEMLNNARSIMPFINEHYPNLIFTVKNVEQLFKLMSTEMGSSQTATLS